MEVLCLGLGSRCRYQAGFPWALTLYHRNSIEIQSQRVSAKQFNKTVPALDEASGKSPAHLAALPETWRLGERLESNRYWAEAMLTPHCWDKQRSIQSSSSGLFLARLLRILRQRLKTVSPGGEGGQQDHHFRNRPLFPSTAFPANWGDWGGEQRTLRTPHEPPAATQQPL